MSVIDVAKRAFGTESKPAPDSAHISWSDILTPASAITLAGLVICIVGSLYLNQWLGLILIAAGRAFDLIDGPVARATKVTHFSLIFDPIADKIALIAILISCWHYHLVPTGILAYIFCIHVIISIVSVIAERRGTATGAAIAGKLHLFLHNVALVAYLLGHMLTPTLGQALTTIAPILVICSVPFAILTLRAYARQIQ